MELCRKIKSNAPACSHEQQLRPRADIFLQGGGWGGQYLNSNFSKRLELSETSRARKLTFGLQVNIDKANSRRYHVTR